MQNLAREKFFLLAVALLCLKIKAVPSAAPRAVPQQLKSYP